MERNIRLAYILTSCKFAWFWLGVWVFYYLRYTDYAGIGIIETALVVTFILTEIPTGAIADLLGKKKTLLLSFVVTIIGSFLMAYAPDFYFLALSVVVLGLSGTLYSGTIEAIVYDSLKQIQQEKRYAKVITNINSISFIAPAVCGLLGGYLYLIARNLPFILQGIFAIFGLIAAFFLIEPRIDTEVFSWKNYLSQTKRGIGELTKNRFILKQVLLLLSIGVILVIDNEMLSSFLAVEFEFTPVQLGFFWALLSILSGVLSQFTPYLIKIFAEKMLLIISGIIIAVTFIISPIAGLILGGTSIIIRALLHVIFLNTGSIIINENVESKYRATSISTYNMLRNIPYALSAYFIGNLANSYSAKTTAFYLGIILIVLLVFQIIIGKRTMKFS